MRLPTVRVKHPELGFITINAADLTEEHELHEVQAHDFDLARARRVAAAVRPDPALRDAAADLLLRMVAFRRRTEGAPFGDLPDTEKLAVLQILSGELAQAEASYEADQRERTAYEAQQAVREAAEAVRQRQEAEPEAPPPVIVTPSLRVEKGARGYFYVLRGDEAVSKGFRDQAAAEAERARLTGEVSE